MGIVGCGVMLAGLVAGALFGGVWVSIATIGIGCIIAAAASWRQSYKEQAAASRKLAQYPPYGY